MQELTAAGGEAFFFQVDVSSEFQVQGLIEKTTTAYDRMDVLVLPFALSAMCLGMVLGAVLTRVGRIPTLPRAAPT